MRCSRATTGLCFLAASLVACAGESTLLSGLGGCVGPERGLDTSVALALGDPEGAWIAVRSLAPTEPSLDDVPRFIYVAGEYDVVGGDLSAVHAAQNISELGMGEAHIDDIEVALQLGSEVFVRIGEFGRPDKVDYAIAFAGDEFAFLGSCARLRYTEPLQATLGVAGVRALVGQTSRELLVALGHEPEPESEHVFLTPGDAPPALLERLVHAQWRLVSLPPSWRSNYTACARVDEGWNECLSLRSWRLASGGPVNLYFDPTRPYVEIVLLEGGSLTGPIVMLGAVDLAKLAARDGVALRSDDFVLDIALIGERSAAGSAAGTESGPAFRAKLYVVPPGTLP